MFSQPSAGRLMKGCKHKREETDWLKFEAIHSLPAGTSKKSLTVLFCVHISIFNQTLHASSGRFGSGMFSN